MYEGKAYLRSARVHIDSVPYKDNILDGIEYTLKYGGTCITTMRLIKMILLIIVSAETWNLHVQNCSSMSTGQ